MSAREQILYSENSILDSALASRSAGRHRSINVGPSVLLSRLSMIWLGFRNRLSAMIGSWLETTHASARLRPFESVSPNSGEAISLSTTREYSILSVGGRRFYFGRISGKFDGASSPLSAPESRYHQFQ